MYAEARRGGPSPPISFVSQPFYHTCPGLATDVQWSQTVTTIVELFFIYVLFVTIRYVVALKTAQCNVTVRVRVRVVRARGRGWDFFPFFCLC